MQRKGSAIKLAIFAIANENKKKKTKFCAHAKRNNQQSGNRWTHQFLGDHVNQIWDATTTEENKPTEKE